MVLLMVESNETLSIRRAHLNDVPACKAICDANRDALGFIMTAIFNDAIVRRQLLVAELDGILVGFVRFNHHVRGDETAIYDICVIQQHRCKGVANALIITLSKECKQIQRNRIVLRCPEGLAANSFYEHIGFTRIAIESGKRRNLVRWHLILRGDPCTL